MSSAPPRILLLICVPLLAIAACTRVPELDAQIPPGSRNADYPQLQPLDPALFAGQTPEDEAAELEDTLTARIAGLNSRASAIRPPVLDAQTQDRMREGVAE